MERLGRSARIAAVVGIALAIVLLRSGGAMAAADTATITFHVATCPAGVGSAIFEDCHGNGLAGVELTIGPGGAETTVTSNDDGVAGPITVPSDVVIDLAVDPAAFDQYLGGYVYCRDLTTDTVLIDNDLGGSNRTSGTLSPGARVVCDLYLITPASSGSGGTTSTTTLPATGSGAMGGIDSSLFALLAAACGLLFAGVILRKRSA